LVTLLVVLGATMVPTPALAATQPAVQSVSPASGTTDGGTTVTLKGDHFSHVRKVLFGSAAGSSVHVQSTSKLTVRTPKHGAGTVNIRVETTAGESAETSKDQYAYKVIWTPREAPLPPHASADPNASLAAVSCGSAGSCVAVGDYTDSANKQQGLLERLAAGRWEAIKAPLPGKPNSNPGASLTSVACPTSSTCVAVGIYADKNNHVDALMDTLSHGTWSAKKAPLPAGVATGSTVDLDAVACHSSGSCAAVGIYTDSAGTQGLLETFASGHWSATKAHLPADAVTNQNDQMSAVVCPAAGTCSAVGVYDNPQQVGLVETLSHGHWHGDEAQLPGNASTGFQSVTFGSVSCKSATHCTAVGQYRNKKSRNEGLIESLPVGLSSGSQAAVPSDGNSTPDVGLAAVSCASSGCTAVGGYSDHASALAGLIEALPGPGHPTRAPLPSAGAAEPVLSSVACPGAGSCTSVGSFVDRHGHAQGLFEAQSGNSWHAKAAPLPANAIASPSFPYLLQVSCPRATACVAIGQYEDSHNGVQGLLEQD
jgi:hypothetical protein